MTDTDRPDAADNSSRVEEAAPAYKTQDPAYDPAAAGVHVLRRLKDSDFTDRQAQGVVLAVRDLVGDLATKSDLEIAKNELCAEMAGLGGDLRAETAELGSGLRAETAELGSSLRAETAGLGGKLRTELAQLGGDLRAETAGLGGKLRAEMADLKTELKTDIADVKTEIVQSERRLEKRMGEMALQTQERMGEMELQAKEAELRLTRAMSRNLLWTIGLLTGIMVGGFGIAVTVILNALST